MVDRRICIKVSSYDHSQRSSLLQTSNTPLAGSVPRQTLALSLCNKTAQKAFKCLPNDFNSILEYGMCLYVFIHYKNCNKVQMNKDSLKDVKWF